MIGLMLVLQININMEKSRKDNLLYFSLLVY
jgi:hypothetical protein